MSRDWLQPLLASIETPRGTARQCHKIAKCNLPYHTSLHRHSNQNHAKEIPHLTLNTEVTNITLHDREVEVTVTKSGEEVRRWLEEHNELIAFGVDVEWRPNFSRGEDNPVALLQISAEKTCLLIQLMYIDYVPEVSEELAQHHVMSLSSCISSSISEHSSANF